MNDKNPTLVDVARHAGISVTTVSRVLNRSGYFSEDTRIKVEDAVQALGYRPNWNARLLKGMPSKLVGLVIPDLFNVFYTGLANEALFFLRDYGYDMLVFVNEEDAEKDLSYLNILMDKHVDGVIYVHPIGGDNTRMLLRMVKNGIPVVEMNRQRNVGVLDAVVGNDVGGTKLMMQYLFELGHRRIGLINGTEAVTTGAQRSFGYRMALEEAGIPFDPDLLRTGCFSQASGKDSAEALLSLASPPTAMFACSHRLVMGILEEVHERSLCIPQDFSLVAFDEVDWLDFWNPPITVVDVPVKEMARQTVDLLHYRMNQKESERNPETIFIEPSLVIRSSCQENTRLLA